MERVVYIRPEDEELWAWAKAYARSRRMSTSALVLTALDEYRQRVEGERRDADT